MALCKNYHFIAVGGAVMHQLALHLHLMGHKVTGSDDAIYDPARANLAKQGILPQKDGWDAARVHSGLDAVILGMHARADNPELLKAQELNIKVYSFPEFVYEASKDKTRVVVAGSHGKTTTTSMIMHVLRCLNMDFDYLVGAQIEGFNYVVKTSDSAPVIILEGDEYLTSPLDLTSKFLHYHPHYAIITGIAWDHINVFPQYDLYVDTFRKFMQMVKKEIFYYHDDKDLELLSKEPLQADCKAYFPLNCIQNGDELQIQYEGKSYPIHIFGAHNMANMSAALNVCLRLGVNAEDFFEQMASFKGAAKRMELVKDIPEKNFTIYKDFAHAPSKVKATVSAVRNRYPKRKMVAALELHTFSSLQPDFIEQYKGSLDVCDTAAVYIDKEALKQKNRAPIDADWLREQFGRTDIVVPESAEKLKEWLQKENQNDTVVLMMSSGHWGGMKPEDVF